MLRNYIYLDLVDNAKTIRIFRPNCYANEHEPVHVHGKSQGREARAKFIIINGVVNEINYTDVTGRPPLQPNEIRYFKEMVSNKSDEIVAKWIDFFVLHQSIISENITRRPK